MSSTGTTASRHGPRPRMHDPTSRGNRRGVGLVAGLQLAGVLTLLVVVVGLLGRQAMQSADMAAADAVGLAGQGGLFRPVKREIWPPRVERIGDPDRVKQIRRVGRTYRTVLKGGFAAQASDMDYGLREPSEEVTVVYVFEMVARRTVESNDGHRVVELIDFSSLRNVKLLTDRDGLAIDLGESGEPILQPLWNGSPGAKKGTVTVRELAEAILCRGSREVAGHPRSKAFAAVDPLEGKRVRVTYVDGTGIESVQPVGCRVTRSEQAYLVHMALLSDAFLSPDVFSGPAADTVSRAEQHLFGLFDPTLRMAPEGDVAIQRSDHLWCGDGNRLTFEVDAPDVALPACGAGPVRGGRFAPEGTFCYNVREGFLESANLAGQMRWFTMEEDHLLSHVTLDATFSIRYRCEIL